MTEYATKNDVQIIVNKAVEDLSGVVAQLAQMMHKELLIIKGDIAELKQDVSILKQDVTVLKRDMIEVKHDVAELKSGHNKLINRQIRLLKSWKT
jgi:hypothetical protein